MLLALAGVVAALHLLVIDHLAEDRFGWGQHEAALRRIEVAFVNELAPAAPPEPVAAEPPPRPAGPPRLAAVAPASKAPPPPPPPASAALPDTARQRPGDLGNSAHGPTAPMAADSPTAQDVARPPTTADAAVAAVAAQDPPAQDQPAQGPTAKVAQAEPSRPDAPSLEAGSPAMAGSGAAASPQTPPLAASAPSAVTAFEWPPSTRMSYVLLGHYRGPVHGRAQVEWLRSGNRYQVHLEASVAPFLSRRVSSEGELTDQGLAPRAMQGEQRVMLRTPRRWTLKFTPDKVTLIDGREEPAQPGMQDEASQFVQLTWIFTTQPQLLQVGRTLEMPLALSRRLERWTFEVKAEEMLRLPFGEIATFHVKPRREIAKGGDMVAQMWFAPSLQYLPVRILIHQDAETWIDLQLERPPLQAAR